MIHNSINYSNPSEFVSLSSSIICAIPPSNPCCVPLVATPLAVEREENRLSQHGSIQCNYTMVLAITINSPFQLERTDKAQVMVQHNVPAINPCCMPLVAIPLASKDSL